MKKLLVFLVSVFVLTSCDRRIDWDNGRSYRSRNKYYTSKDNSTFRQEDLIGTWGCTDIVFGRNDVKEFVVTHVGEANMLLQGYKTVSRFNRTYKYVLSGKYLTFQSKYPDEYGIIDGPYEFKIVEYLPGSLFLQDGRGIHEVRLYGVCSGY